MSTTKFLMFAILAVMSMTTVAYAGAQADKKKPQEPTEESIAELQEVLDNLSVALKEKDYEEAVSQIDKVALKYKGGDKSLKGKAVDALKGCLKKKNKDVKKSAITALGGTGGKAISILMKGAKASRKDPNLQQRYLSAAGKLRDEKNIQNFVKYLNNKDSNTIKTAIYALGFYNESSTKVRKEIVKDLLKQYSSIASAFDVPSPSSAAKERYTTLFNPFESTLKKLTKQEMQGADVWARWYRKEGKKKKEW